MSKSASPTWLLSEKWGAGTDPFNWILYRKGKKTWRAAGYYPSAELLLKSFYRKLTRTEPADPDLIRHVEVLSERAQAAAARLYEQINTQQAQSAHRGLAHACTLQTTISGKQG